MILLSILQTKQSFFQRLGLSAAFLTLLQLVISSPLDITRGLLLPSIVGATRPSCAAIDEFPKWYQPSEKFDNGDCEKAITMFNDEYVQNHGGARYEFYNVDHQPIHGIPTQRVPLKFGSGMLHTSPYLDSPPHELNNMNQAHAS